MIRKFLAVAVLALGVLGAANAYAIPNLQIYIDGATYDVTTETWVINSSSFKLWVISDGSTINDVKLTAAFLTSETGTVSLTGTTTGHSVFTDTSAASNPTFESTSADGAVPITGDGSPLPTHDIYGAGTSFHQWGLGDFTLTDSPITDFTNNVDLTASTGNGEIKAYEVVITGYSQVHFDAFNHIVGAHHTSYVFAPFSHDGEGGGSGGTGGGGSGGSGGSGGGGGSVPEPVSMLLLGGGMIGLLAANRRK